jgi:elongation factor 1 alpha-like protein
MAGDSADLVLTGVDASALHSGCVVCHPEFPVRLAVKFIAQVLVLDVGMPLLKGHALTIHTHSAREAGVISHLVALCDGKTGAVTKQRPRCLIGGQVRGAGCWLLAAWVAACVCLCFKTDICPSFLIVVG